MSGSSDSVSSYDPAFDDISESKKQKLYAQLYAAIGDVTSLSEKQITARQALCIHLSSSRCIEVLRESGVVTLILQSLVITSNFSRPTDKVNSPITEQLKVTIKLLALIDKHDAEEKLISQYGTVEKLLGLLSLRPQLFMVTNILNLVGAIVTIADVNTSVWVSALTHILPRLHRVAIQDGRRPYVTAAHLQYYGAVQSTLHLLHASYRDNINAKPRLPYADASPFVTLMRNIIQDHPKREWNSRLPCVVYSALSYLFECDCSRDNQVKSLDDNDSVCACLNASARSAGDAQRRRDLAEFAASDDFVPTLWDLGSPRLLRNFMRLFDNSTLMWAFTKPRLEKILDYIGVNNISDHQWDIKSLVIYLPMLVRLTAHFPEFAQSLSRARGFAPILNCIEVHHSKYYESIRIMDCDIVGINTVLLLNNMLNTASDATLMAKQLLASGAMKTCCALLTFFATTAMYTWLFTKSVTSLLHLLRVMISTSDTSPDPAVHQRRVTPWNPFVAELIAGRGLQALELLQNDDHLNTSDGAPALHELEQLRTLLVRMAVIAPETASEKKVRLQTLEEMGGFLKRSKLFWQDAFDTYIVCKLKESGYIQQLNHSRPTNEPSQAVLSLSQVRARESIIAFAKSKVKSEHMTSDVVMKLQLNESYSTQKTYSMVIRLNDEKFPCNAAHFRAGLVRQALGNYRHVCIVPRGKSAAMPVLVFYKYDCECHRNTDRIQFPDSDIVYGEYSMSASRTKSKSENKITMYPVGTVLMYPRSVLPGELENKGNHDSPWFIVFRQCPVNLMRGAVPVGRVMSCVAGNEPAKHDSGDEPFDAPVLKGLNARCQAKWCLEGNYVGKMTVRFLKFKPRI